MYISVLPDCGVPAYKQIFEQIAAQIISGETPPFTPLPPIRTVAKETGVSVITVRSAWDALEAAGLIETRAGSGCYVRVMSEEEKETVIKDVLSPHMKALSGAAAKFGLTYDQICAVLRSVWDGKDT